MNFVEPIRDRKKIAQIKNQLRGQRRYRDLLLFVVGINTALRISDLLELQVEHFLDDHQHIKQRFWIKEQKKIVENEKKLTSSSYGMGGGMGDMGGGPGFGGDLPIFRL